MLNFYERQRRNRRQTWLLMLLFVTLFLLVGAALDLELTGFPMEDGSLPVNTVAALVLSGSLGALSYFKGGELIMTTLMAMPIDENNDEHRQFRNIATEMALAAGLPVPRLYVIPDPSPNALATGRDPAHAIIAITHGALVLLDREETQGVVAHEMSHIANRDTLLMTVVAILLGGVVMLSDWGRRALYFSRRDRKNNPPWLALIGLLLVAVSPLLSRLLAMAVSRQREYLADATAVELSRNPIGLARALEKIAATQSPLRGASRGTAHMFISDPLKRRSDDSSSRFADLFSTHPPIAQRIALLRGYDRM